LRKNFCLCDRIPRIDTRVRLVVVRHAHEYFKTTNTARLAALALTNSELHEYGLKEKPFDPSVLEGGGCWFLFPGEGPACPASAPPERLVVVDGSWHQAKKILRGVPALWNMPRLSLAAPPPTSRRLRTSPHQEGMSTLEAIARAMALLEGEHIGRLLDQLHEEMIDRVLQLRGRLG